MKREVDILLVGQTPPPYHGQAVVTAMLFDHDWGDLRIDRLRMAYSGSIDAVGKANLGKIFHLLYLIFKTWKLAWMRRPEVLYYLPASSNWIPVLRDIVYLSCVRWCFPKIVFHYHAGGLPEYLETAGWLGCLARKAYSNADVSVELCRTDCSPGELFDARKTVYVPNGLDVEIVERKREGVMRGLFLGALNEGKGVSNLIETAMLLKKEKCDFEFQLVGAWASEVYREEVETKIKQEGLEHLISLPGILKGGDKWQVYADADFFIFPSHYQSENFPLVIIEAMAYGLPVISTRWRGIPQLVGESGAAILCDVDSPDQYVEAVMSIYHDEALSEAMGGAAQDHYQKNYTRGQFVLAMEGVFNDVLKVEG